MKKNLFLILLIPLLNINQTQICNNCDGESIGDNSNLSKDISCIEIITNKSVFTKKLEIE